MEKKMIETLNIQSDSINIDYKDVDFLKRFVSSEGKIIPSRRSGLNCKQHRKITKAIKRARAINLLPFINKEN
jgi:small subunit ribosomal protein S18